MSSLGQHLRRHEERPCSRLAFRRDCPICRTERVAGPLPDPRVVPLKARATIALGAILAGGTLPGGVAQADRSDTLGQAIAVEGPSPPAPPQHVPAPPDALATAAAPASSDSEPSPSRDVAHGQSARPVPHVDRSPPTRADRPPEPARPSIVPPPGPATATAAETAPQSTAQTGGVARATEPATHESRVEPSPPTRAGGASEPALPAPRSVHKPASGPENARLASPERAGGSGAHARGEARERSPVDDRPLKAGGDRRSSNPGDAPAREEPASVRPPTRPVANSSTRGGSPAPAGGKGEIHVVKSGECLWEIAAGRLGANSSDAEIAKEVTRLWKLNRERIGTGNPDLVYPGQTVLV